MSSTELSKRRSTFWLNALALIAATLAIAAVTWKNSQAATTKPQLDVSFNSTHDLFRDLNSQFEKPKAAEGSAGWSNRLPNHSEPFASTIVFVVRKGNPRSIQDWQDLVRKDVSVNTPDPKTSANGKLSVLAAWGSVIHRGGTAASALAYVKQLHAHLTQGQVGDVHLTWENEALLKTAQFPRDYEIVYPPISIRAEPKVAWLDSAAARHHPEVSTKAYSEFLYTPPAQELLAQHGYRPSDPAVLKKYAKRFPSIDLFLVSEIAKDWDDANQRFFAPGGIWDEVHPVTIALKMRP